jgi:hypothetical protein
MEKEKKKLSDNEKAKLIYTIELAFFAVAFIVLGILFLVDVIPLTERRETIFLYLTLVGGCLLLADFCWAAFSSKHRKKVSLFDKTLILPVSLFLICFDIYALATQLIANGGASIFKYVIGIDFLYLALSYVAEAIYHYFYPVPGLLEEEKKEEKKPINSGNDDSSPKE